MSRDSDPAFFALLVHRGLLPRDVVARAFASGKPKEFLLQSGAVSAAQWDEWVRTEGGVRPELSRYELGELLGEGGTARVFRAKDRSTGQAVALKILRRSLCKDSTALHRFVQESKLLIDLDCPHIVKGYRVAREGEVFFCAMELVDGECLLERVGRAPLDEDTALRVVEQIAGALAYLRGRSLVHRDIKPGNILLTGQGRAVLIDLGFAVSAGTADGDEGTTAGTVAYISPEQARGQAALDVRADIYSLGATLYHLVTGSLPFEGGSGEEIMAKQVLEALSGGAIRERGLSPQLHYFIEKMMAKEKEIRFQDPGQLAAEIRAHLQRLEREREAEAKAQERDKRKRRRLL
jgi:serine/threonine-protein kinase